VKTVHLESTRTSKSTAVGLYACETLIKKKNMKNVWSLPGADIDCDYNILVVNSA
jgi:hypothetical protein